MNRKRWMLLLVVLALISACTRAPQTVADTGPFTVSGFIEATEIAIAPENGGRVTAFLADIGDEVEAGAPLAQLDDRIAQAQVVMAEAKVAEARARLDLARNAVRDATLRSAEAQLAQAQAGRIGACQAWDDTRAILDNPQEIDRQIAVTRAQLRAADAARLAAGAYKDVAEIGADGFYEGRDAIAALPDKVLVYQGGFAGLPIDLPQEILDFLGDNPPPSGTYRLGDTEIIIDGGNITIYQYIHVSMPVAAHFAPNAYWQAWAGANTAQAAYEGLQRVLGLLYRLRDNPAELQAAVEEAAALCQQAEAQEHMAQAQIDGLRAGAMDEELAALEALVAVATAELEMAQVELAKQTLAASTDGMVLKRPLEVGELAGPGSPLLVLADLNRVYLTLYLPNRDLARVRSGESIAIRVNGYAQAFMGTVISVGQEAEFPPSSVPQPEDRAGLVFSVRVQIENADHLLKPGLLATATFE